MRAGLDALPLLYSISKMEELRITSKGPSRQTFSLQSMMYSTTLHTSGDTPCGVMAL